MKVKELKALLETLDGDTEIAVTVTDCGGGIGTFPISPGIDNIEGTYVLDIDIGHNHG